MTRATRGRGRVKPNAWGRLAVSKLGSQLVFVTIGVATVIPVGFIPWLVAWVVVTSWPDREYQSKRGWPVDRFALEKWVRIKQIIPVVTDTSKSTVLSVDGKPWPIDRLSAWWALWAATAAGIAASYIPSHPIESIPLLALPGVYQTFGSALGMFIGVCVASETKRKLARPSAIQTGQDTPSAVEPPPLTRLPLRVWHALAQIFADLIAAKLHKPGEDSEREDMEDPRQRFMSRIPEEIRHGIEGIEETENVRRNQPEPKWFDPLLNDPATRTTATKTAAVAAITLAAAAVLVGMTPAGWVEAVLISGLATTAAAGISPSKQAITQARATWEEQNEYKHMWEMVFAQIPKLNPPSFSADTLHTLPGMRFAGFVLTSPDTWSTLANHVGAITTAASQVFKKAGKPAPPWFAIAPTPAGTGQTDNTTEDAYQINQAILWYPTDTMSGAIWWNEQIAEYIQKQAIRSSLNKMFAETKIVTQPIVNMVQEHTRRGTGTSIWEISVIVPYGATNQTIFQLREQLKRALAAEWVAIAEKQISGNPTRQLSIWISNTTKPRTENLKHPKRGQEVLAAQWAQILRDSKAVNDRGEPPSLERSEPSKRQQGIIDAVFRLPGSMSVDDLVKQAAQIRANSGYAFVDIKPHPDTPSKALMMYGERDPLARAYLFDDYAEQVIHQPDGGELMLKWAYGVHANGELGYFDFTGESPHLLLAGATGNGKSVLAQTMFLQLLCNNTPEDLHMWLVEPKVDMYMYQRYAHVKRFLSNTTQKESLATATANMFDDLIAEMDRRNDLFAQHPETPKKLSEARAIALREGPGPNGEPHPLMLPAILVVIEECGDLYEDPGTADKPEKEARQRCVISAGVIARKARSAGIHMVNITQRPTRNVIPTQIKGNSGRIGLGTNDAISSMVIIDRPGLETIRDKGRGICLAGATNQEFRSLYINETDQTSKAAQLFDHLPQHHTDTQIVVPTTVVSPPPDEFWS